MEKRTVLRNGGKDRRAGLLTQFIPSGRSVRRCGACRGGRFRVLREVCEVVRTRAARPCGVVAASFVEFSSVSVFGVGPRHFTFLASENRIVCDLHHRLSIFVNGVT